MRFLIDAQLPPALARWIAARGHRAVHVLDIDMIRASDAEIWERALAEEAVIVTKDSDFMELAALRPRAPAILWIRIPNTRTRPLLEWFEGIFPSAVAAFEQGERLIEVDFPTGN